MFHSPREWSKEGQEQGRVRGEEHGRGQTVNHDVGVKGVTKGEGDQGGGGQTMNHDAETFVGTVCATERRNL